MLMLMSQVFSPVMLTDMLCLCFCLCSCASENQHLVGRDINIPAIFPTGYGKSLPYQMLVCTKNVNVLILIISPLKISPKRTSRRRWNQLVILLPTICWPGWDTPNEYETKMLVLFHILALQSQQFWHCLKLQLLSLWNSMTLQPFAVFTGSAKVTTLINWSLPLAKCNCCHTCKHQSPVSFFGLSLHHFSLKHPIFLPSFFSYLLYSMTC